MRPAFRSCARERGGRVLTLRGFNGGAYADAGAARIPEKHEWTMRYVRAFGLPLLPFYPDAGLFAHVRRGVRKEVDFKSFADAVEQEVGIDVGDGKHWHKIEGGNDLLPRAFAEKLGEKIIYGAPVSKVEQDTSRPGAARRPSLTYGSLWTHLPPAIVSIPFGD